jgi:hypothetical protein
MKIELPLDGRQRARVRNASDLVFKSTYLLEMLILIAQEERVWHGLFLRSVPGVGPSFVSNVLTRYQQGDLLALLPKEDGQARDYIAKVRDDDPFWTLIVVWAHDLIEDRPGRQVALVS